MTRFLRLDAVPHVALGRFPTPVQPFAGIPALVIKRDDLSAEPFGGNKVRALEYLLAACPPAARLVTLGGAGSSHALSTIVFGRSTGHRVLVGRWRQVMNETASVVAERIAQTAELAPVFSNPALAFVWAFAQRVRGAWWIPGGGTSPLGMLGHVNAGLELADQIARGEVERPGSIVLPLGSGGTTAGIALGLHLASMPIPVTGVRVVPRIVGNARRLHSLARRAARLITALGGPSASSMPHSAISIVQDFYGGAYGQETEAGRRASGRFREAMGFPLDATYSAKAFAVALERAHRGPTLFWLTFDPRMLSI